MTDGAGCCSVELATRPGRATFEFEADGGDARGVHWAGRTLETWNLVLVRRGHPLPVRNARVTVTRAPLSHELYLSPELRRFIRAKASGELLLQDVDELTDCLTEELPAASLAMVGKVLDGTVKSRGLSEGWWSDDWDRMPLGSLPELKLVKERIISSIGTGGWERLRGSGVFVRNVGAHHKFEPVSMEEALASTRVVLDFLSRWWGPE